MSIDDMIKKDDVLKIVDELHTLREQHQDCTCELDHKMWSLTNYASGYIMTKLKLSYKELEEFKSRYDDQLELDLYKK